MDKDVFPDLFTGFIIGAIVGAAIGFLCAPLTGKDTREIVKEGAIKIKSRTAGLAEDVKAVTAEAIDKVHTKRE